LGVHGSLQALAQPKMFCAFVRQLWRKEWVVYAKKPFRGPEYVLQYLAHYTHRVAISNHRLLAFTDDQVTFRWKHYAHGNKKRKMTLSTDEFLRRFLLHVLPRGFTRIRHFGLLANRRRAEVMPLCRRLLAAAPLPSTETSTLTVQVWMCPECAGPMMLIVKLTARQIWLRSVGLASYANSS
jgi:hypothetical protein